MKTAFCKRSMRGGSGVVRSSEISGTLSARQRRWGARFRIAKRNPECDPLFGWFTSNRVTCSKGVGKQCAQHQDRPSNQYCRPAHRWQAYNCPICSYGNDIARVVGWGGTPSRQFRGSELAHFDKRGFQSKELLFLSVHVLVLLVPDSAWRYLPWLGGDADRTFSPWRESMLAIIEKRSFLNRVPTGTADGRPETGPSRGCVDHRSCIGHWHMVGGWGGAGGGIAAAP